MSSFPLTALVEAFARQRGVDLPPHWADNIDLNEIREDQEDALAQLATRAGWRAPTRLSARPRANQFPLVIFSPMRGWGIAEQWEGLDSVRVARAGRSEHWEMESGTRFFELPLPRAVERDAAPTAVSVFWRSILLRRKVFFSAILATVIVNVLGLATALYSMQVYDRVIPRGSYATLWVLTVGVLGALALDFILRTTRGLMIDREAQKIDQEVSEFFFARAQAIRLDARPNSIGTLAAQLRTMEQVRSLLSSGTIFLLADLPFALFFIFVIWTIGGVVAAVPLISFPIALILAFIFARLIRKDTQRAQASSNRKNGMLVESFDAAETVKANRGGWHMLGRWNDLMDEVELHEEPIRKWSVVATSVFQALQQTAYVLMIAVGALVVGQGEMTMGALIAVAIIGGRVNGPLVSQLPNFMVQWGYSKSSLDALDSILALPLDRPEGAEALRPEKLDGPIRLQDVAFAYPGSRTGIAVPMLEVKPGERVAIIGGVGSGKSTLLRLMGGLYGPAQGGVTIGGLEMSHVADEVLRRHIGYLPQDMRLLNGTLRDNILLGLTNPGDDRVMQVAESLGMAPMIASHPMGLDLPISEGGRGLSGGQRTLAGLTRLILAQPQVWLLDEPTANLDQATEARVLDMIRRSMTPTSTLVLVTHRLQLLSLVNRVIVMVNGQIRLDGAPKDVITKLKQQAQPAQATQVPARAPGTQPKGGGAAGAPAGIDAPAPQE